MFNLREAVRRSLAIKKWKVEDLATSMNKKVSTLNSSLYNGNPTLSTLTEISKEFDIPLSEFIKRGEI